MSRLRFEFPLGPPLTAGGVIHAKGPPPLSPKAAVLKAWGLSAEATSSEDGEEDCPRRTYRNEDGAARGMCREARRKPASRERRVAAERDRARRARLEREAFLSSSLGDLAALEVASPARRLRPGPPLAETLPAELLARAVSFLGDPRDWCRVRAVSASFVAIGEARWTDGFAVAKRTATAAALERRWGCLASGWRWLSRVSTHDLLRAAKASSDDARCDEDEEKATIRRAASATCFEALGPEVRFSFNKAVAACARRDPEFLVDCFETLARDVAATLRGEDVATNFRTFERWARGIERGADLLETIVAARATHHDDRPAAALRAKALAAFRESYVFAVRSRALAHLDAARDAAIARAGLDPQAFREKTRTLFARKSELSSDAHFAWAKRKLAADETTRARLRNDARIRNLHDALAEIDRAAAVPGNHAASLRNDIRARILLPLGALLRS